jgi:hypothetical protein
MADKLPNLASPGSLAKAFEKIKGRRKRCQEPLFTSSLSARAGLRGCPTASL